MGVFFYCCCGIQAFFLIFFGRAFITRGDVHQVFVQTKKKKGKREIGLLIISLFFNLLNFSVYNFHRLFISSFFVITSIQQCKITRARQTTTSSQAPTRPMTAQGWANSI
ncbi:hypothetical protein BX661DRAFT_185119 [Kickxella alabastrina]|uniref:uncharacterized protein n=1 Tax=Kickxella alabastrina TaxID=61397 RepID=UPI00221FBCC5|nr:uncharacterized protein BX661DRAFT_185119 [Kickxella alabastrina]KAI7825019.1 hypothetical protein BX661DRAFT_185119 [Kickxella alabastrina]